MSNLFSIKGRATRTQFWMSQLIIMIPYFMIITGNENGNTAIMTIGVIGTLILFIPVLFISIKRWHDLNKGGIFVLLNLIPYVGNFITVIWQGFMNPVNDSNQYGEDPRL